MNFIKFITEVILIPLGSCDMVLGVQWLSALGSIYWDFKKLKMDFRLQEHQITLKGIPPQKLKVLEGAPSAKILRDAAQLCLIQVTKTPRSELTNKMILSRVFLRSWKL